MKRQPQFYTRILAVLRELHKQHPTYNIGRHISTALDEYGDLWNVSDKEFLHALDKYKVEQDLVTYEATDEELKKIIDDGLHLSRMFAEDEEEEEY